MDDLKQQRNKHNEESIFDESNESDYNASIVARPIKQRQQREIRKRPTRDFEEILSLSSFLLPNIENLNILAVNDNSNKNINNNNNNKNNNINNSSNNNKRAVISNSDKNSKEPDPNDKFIRHYTIIDENCNTQKQLISQNYKNNKNNNSSSKDCKQQYKQLVGKRFSLASPLSSSKLHEPVLTISKQLSGKTCSNFEIEESFKATHTSVAETEGFSSSQSKATKKIQLKMPPIKDKKETKKKERWLLTRKTWKYMTDAGRKLIPDGSQNRSDDLPKIERHFQNICSAEPRFILWKRKASYPGAIGASRHSKYRLKKFLSRSHKSISSADEVEDLTNPETREANKNADQIITILQNYLNLNVNSKKTAPLLGTKTVRPDQTQSLSAQRPNSTAVLGKITTKTATMSMMSKLQPQLSASDQLLEQQQIAQETQAKIQDLLEKLHEYSKSCSSGSKILVKIEKITPEILENKLLLKQIYSDLKTQQLHRILGRHSTAVKRSSINLPHATSFSSILNLNRESVEYLKKRDSSATLSDISTKACFDSKINNCGNANQMTKSNDADTVKIRNILNENNQMNQTYYDNIDLRSIQTNSYIYKSSNVPHAQLRSVGIKHNQQGDSSAHDAFVAGKSIKVDACYSNDSSTGGQQSGAIPKGFVKKSPPITYSTLGTQTDFVHLHELQRLAKDYETKKKEEERTAAFSPTDDESDKGCPAGQQSRSSRKSSIDNEDVSQSVSDTIKRYLRMARKKSVHDANVNRFKRVNYDRNLRNIKAKGEINPPGMDEGNSKQIQTLDAWPVIALEYIRGIENSNLLNEAHADWQQTLNKRIQLKEDNEMKCSSEEKNKQQQQQLEKQRQSEPSSSLSILSTGQQFLSNLWHGHTGGSNISNHSDNTSYHPSTSSSTISISSAPAVGSNSAGTDTSYQRNHSKNQLTMQKSKSSSNVGQFVSAKIWKSRSKSQTRTPSFSNISKQIWTPKGNGVWSSVGKCLKLTDTKLEDLYEIERKVLHKVAIEKINQLNIGVNVVAPPDNTTDPITSKTPKRRPLLMKRKAITTSFFDSGKNKQDSKARTISGSGSVFGLSLEKCVENDQKLGRDSESLLSDNGGYKSESRNSIVLTLEANGKKVGSCESLLTKTTTSQSGNIDNRILSNTTNSSNSATFTLPTVTSTLISLRDASTKEYNLIKTAATKISRSQSDVRRNSCQSGDTDDLIDSLGLSRFNRQRVPALVVACIKHLEERGLNTIGIFRVSTSKKRVRQLKEEFDQGDITALDPETCPHDVATILKEFFRDLPEPLLCRNLYKAFVKTQKIRNRRLQLEALSHLVQLLPVAHRDTLNYLLKFLAKVVRSSDDVTSINGTILSQGNKMDSNNLATVFAPNILRPTSNFNLNQTTEQDLDEQIDVINVIRTMIDHFEELFKVSSELMDEIYTYMLDSFPQQLDALCERRDFNYCDELDSASSSTPISSPPPVSNLNTDQPHQTMFQDFIPNSMTANSTSSSLFPRRVYSREDVMHERAVTANDPNNTISFEMENGIRRRERSSKMKYANENESELQRCRRFRSSNSSSSTTSTVPSQQNFNDEQKSRNNSLSKNNGNNNNNNNNKNDTKNNNNSKSNNNNYNDNKNDYKNDNNNRNIKSVKKDQIPPTESKVIGFFGKSSIVNNSSAKIEYYQQQEEQSCNSALSAVQHGNMVEKNSVKNRKCSSPFILQRTSVVTASLKIPLQMQSQQQHRSNINHQTDKNCGPIDFSDIPYIEDVPNYSQNDSWSEIHQINEPLIKGSLSFGNNSTKQFFSQRIDRKGSCDSILNSYKQNNISNTVNTQSSNKSNTGDSDNIDYNWHDIQRSYNRVREPKITPCITNIGGAVMRSKTADFERILSQNKKLSDSNNFNVVELDVTNATQQHYQQMGFDGKNSFVRNNKSLMQHSQQSVSSGSNRKPSAHGHIYKRQELISSAKKCGLNKNSN